ncbi:hypothetical protein E2C01_044466 [Portunus trituberculatus]|uniref:Uncharacterized protein n=1 Tax=Portunus trituberculatus TaxID=210409 RepID=A0A5B7FZ40_PORTR|nr:hypothetical protein [Portunus trituberculatus]
MLRAGNTRGTPYAPFGGSERHCELAKAKETPTERLLARQTCISTPPLPEVAPLPQWPPRQQGGSRRHLQDGEVSRGGVMARGQVALVVVGSWVVVGRGSWRAGGGVRCGALGLGPVSCGACDDEIFIVVAPVCRCGGCSNLWPPSAPR